MIDIYKKLNIKKKKYDLISWSQDPLFNNNKDIQSPTVHKNIF